MTGPGPSEIIRWMLLAPAEQPGIIILVVDDSEDDEVIARMASEDLVPSPNFGGVWGTGQRDGVCCSHFQLIELVGEVVL
jgi:hypothetical protein